MKKFGPLVLFLVGVLFIAGVWMWLGKAKKEAVVEEPQEALTEVPLENKPFTSLTPKADGHWVTLKIEKLNKVLGAQTIDYELLYKAKSGTQGTPGTVKLAGIDRIEREILFGSESNKKFRYDEGVEEGTLTLRFRDAKGKLLGKMSTDFHLQSGVSKLTSLDGNFEFILDKISKNYFVTMGTFGLPAQAGLPDKFADKVESGPYGVFSSSDSLVSGKPSLKEGLVTKVSPNIFLGTSE